MNKAFVREPDAQEDLCPRCGTPGQPVGRETMARYLPPESLAELAERANFCPTATCEVVYFDVFERFVTRDALLRPAYPKDPQAPVCACFGFTTQDIDQDLAEGGKARTRAILEKAKSAEARCGELAPNGRSCAAEVQRYFLRHWSGS